MANLRIKVDLIVKLQKSFMQLYQTTILYINNKELV